MPYDRRSSEAEALVGDLADLRHRLHRHPEIGLDLPWTQAQLLSELDGLGFELSTGTSLRSITGVLRGGAAAANPRTVLLRADMDGLPVHETSGVDFTSEIDGAMHACGHDLSVVEHLSDRVAVMYLGRIVEIGTTSEIFDSPRHPYTRALMEAIPYPDPSRRMNYTKLVGEIPSPISPPSGCHFHTRCPVAIDRCAVEVPSATHYTTTHSAACFVAATKVGLVPTSVPEKKVESWQEPEKTTGSPFASPLISTQSQFGRVRSKPRHRQHCRVVPTARTRACHAH